ncbi:MAG: chemotaxis protein CheD [Gammaproteobacteria bacterium]|nr:chemotaxis protein CheD [Gammaproteobacteria bacterium]
MSVANARALSQSNWSHTVEAEVTSSLYLMPGALYIGNEVEEIKTLLGSCVAVTLWHPVDRLVAMTHIVLPTSAVRSGPRYATEAIAQLTRVINQRLYQPSEFEVGLYGGGMMFTLEENDRLDVGERNVRKTRELLQQAGFHIKHSDVLGPVYRHISIKRETGQILLKSTDVSSTMG